MMERLKSRPSSGSSRIVATEEVDGELVEVRRKRKRRTEQPQKARAKKARRTRVLLMLAAAAGVVALVAVYYIARLRYQGDAFRSTISNRISELVGLRTEARSFQVKGLNIGTQKILVKGSETSLLDEAELLQIQVDLKASSWFSGSWDIDNLNVTDARFIIRNPPRGVSIGRHSQLDGREMLMAGLGLSATPETFNVNALRISECDVVWRIRADEVLDHTFVEDLLVTSTSVGATTKLSFFNGKLALKGWPEFDLDRGSGELKRDALHISELRANRRAYGDGGGTMTASATIGLTGMHEATSLVKLKAIDVRGLIPSYWQDKLLGEIEADLEFRSLLAQPGSLQAEGSFVMTEVVLGGLPSQKRLSVHVQKNQYTRLEFERVTGRFRKSASQTEFTDLQGEIDGLISLRGNVAVDAKGNLAGRLQIGLPEDVLEGCEGGKPSFFGPLSEDGFSWVDVNLSGKRDNLKDDLTKKFEVEKRVRDTKARHSFPDLGTKKLNREEGAGSTSIPKNDREKILEDAFEKLIGD